jgi:hypothetical protein
MFGMSKKVWYGIVMAFVVLGVGAFLIFFLSLFFDGRAEAAEYPLPEPPYVFMGLESEVSATFCDAHDGNLVANTGFGQVLYRNPYADVTALFTHHSCAFREDRESYNALGLQFKWYPWNRGRW